MNNIKTETDIINWAKTIVDGKGEKFTPLSKGDMFSIAKYILGMADAKPAPLHNTAQEQETPTMPDQTQEKSAEPCEGDADGIAITTQSPAEEEKQSRNRKVEMSMGCALHLKGIDAQKAYDQYRDAVKEHPKEKTVMDFSTGESSPFAAFAYWLSQPVSVVICDDAAAGERSK